MNGPVPICKSAEPERRTRIDPFVSCWRRVTASNASRGRARRSRAPLAALTRLRRRTTRTAAARWMKTPGVALTRIMHMRRVERRIRWRGPAALGRMGFGLPGL